jgi:hypothetical protein
MCPSIIFEGEEPVMTLGAPGASWIGPGVLQVALNLLDWGMGIQEAIMAPRMVATSNVIDISNRILRRTEKGLVDMGYEVREGTPRAGPVKVLGERNVSIRAKVNQGPSCPGLERSTTAILRTPLNIRLPAAAMPFMPAPTIRTSRTGWPVASSILAGQFAAGTPRISRSRATARSCSASPAKSTRSGLPKCLAP